MCFIRSDARTRDCQCYDVFISQTASTDGTKIQQFLGYILRQNGPQDIASSGRIWQLETPYN